MPHHALEITLTRAASTAELAFARSRMPLAPNHGTTRRMVLINAAPDQATRWPRRSPTGRSPIDVITTHYSDASGKALLNVASPPATHVTLTHAARPTTRPPPGTGQSPGTGPARRPEADRLDREVRQLLAGTTPAHLLTAVGHARTRLPEGPTP
ncbi:hypothetical protein ACIQB5_45730 [Streptomyces sp. NPDC088560]|uniref:hypothetical protein n=1 Tax=Streptomyces sp. NPDC088560 TaxID=3365868 RepID=UPI0038058C89